MTPFVGEIGVFAFTYPPKGWAYCDGQILSISQNQALFALLGATYGGNGQSTFALPSFAATSPCGFGQGPGLQNYPRGTRFGAETVALTTATMPAHGHAMQARGPERSVPRTGAPSATTGPTTTSNQPLYSDGAANVAMAPDTISLAGSNAAHENRQPFITMNYSIALTGIYPSRN